MTKRWPGFALIVVILLLWELASAKQWIDPVSMPRVSTIFVSWAQAIKSGILLQSLGPTVWRIFIGFGLAAIIAVPLGLLMGSIHLPAAGADHRICPADSELGLHPGRHPVPRYRQRDEDICGRSRLPVSDPAQHL
jgi:hypothetical protein